MFALPGTADPVFPVGLPVVHLDEDLDARPLEVLLQGNRVTPAVIGGAVARHPGEFLTDDRGELLITALDLPPAARQARGDEVSPSGVDLKLRLDESSVDGGRSHPDLDPVHGGADLAVAI